MPDDGHRDLEGLTFDEIAERYGEDAAIAAGIAADPRVRSRIPWRRPDSSV